MDGDDLKNWLAILGIGGGLALGSAEAISAEAPARPAGPAGDPPAAVRSSAPLYVVINHEEQYSIWPASEEPPERWRVLHERIDLGGAIKRFPRIGDQRFRVVINHEEQYSIWPLDRRPPKGFRVVKELRERQPCRIDECGRIVAELEEGDGGR